MEEVNVFASSIDLAALVLTMLVSVLRSPKKDEAVMEDVNVLAQPIVWSEIALTKVADEVALSSNCFYPPMLSNSSLPFSSSIGFKSGFA